ncbi:MAG TPA: c-type cytochrome biogenesis protein CcmI [Burkholderiales bacterium]|nr:c-type cytochrome biogenesis protein CcmI [Burkholderiales bacterium]
MSLFFLFAVLMLALALLFVLLPLLRAAKGYRVSDHELIEVAYRTQFQELEADLASGTLDAEQYEASKRELEARRREDLAQAATVAAAPSGDRILARTALALGISMPLAAAGLYAWLGQPEAILNTVAEVPASGAPHGVSNEQIEAMVQKLANRLRENPNDLQGWYMLARSQAILGHFEEALKALDQARKLAPNEPQLLADYADVLATTRGGSLEGEPARLIQKALQMNPNNVKALALAGELEFRNKHYQAAIDYWTRMRSALPADAPQQQITMAEANINQARAALGQPPLPPSIPAAMPPTRTASSAAVPSQERSISGVVTLSPKLAGKVKPGDTLFIFARATNGPPMPLAVMRASAGDLPKTFTLDDSMSMSPSIKLSDYQQVVVSARVSKSGTAMPEKGDLTTTIGPVTPGSSGIKLVIDTVVQ